MPRDAVSRTANVGTVGTNGLMELPRMDANCAGIPTMRSLPAGRAKAMNAWLKNYFLFSNHTEICLVPKQNRILSTQSYSGEMTKK